MYQIFLIFKSNFIKIIFSASIFEYDTSSYLKNQTSKLIKVIFTFENSEVFLIIKQNSVWEYTVFALYLICDMQPQIQILVKIKGNNCILRIFNLLKNEDIFYVHIFVKGYAI